MNHLLIFRLAALALIGLLPGCQPDSGPYEETTRSLAFENFDRLDMGSAFRVDVRSGSVFAVEVKGNRSDVDDLDVSVRSGTLHAQYRNYTRKRRYAMAFTITMPTIRAVSFSGASQSTLTGFTNLTDLRVELTGASKAAVNSNVSRLTADLSGASVLTGLGSGTDLRASLSGASTLETLSYPVTTASLDLSGASTARVRVADALTVKASGGSKVRYQGAPRVSSQLSGASSVERE
ncbi:GIN domain-containing protein [Spirosoma sp. 209]|uniref:GIN domain-containing protein n=1 Tax=Spirosoma sp. 209 TaxID=1955701 RepID=UPI00098D246F|nr:DUF2807 domain-containing protein [Spirosoma sp. 209]